MSGPNAKEHKVSKHALANKCKLKTQYLLFCSCPKISQSQSCKSPNSHSPKSYHSSMTASYTLFHTWMNNYLCSIKDRGKLGIQSNNDTTRIPSSRLACHSAKSYWEKYPGLGHTESGQAGFATSVRASSGPAAPFSGGCAIGLSHPGCNAPFL